MEIVDRLKSLQDGDGHGFEAWVRDHAYAFREWEVAKCWYWDDWPGRECHDFPEWPSGQAPIDLVAEKTDGSLAAIQCKFYRNASVTPKQVREFAGAASGDVFAERWFIVKATLPETVRKEADRLRVRFPDVDEACASLLESTTNEEENDPRGPMQDEAVAACVRVLRQGLPEHSDVWLGKRTDWMPVAASRATLVLPCGTGKTRVSMRVMSELCSGTDLGLVLVPSIALVAQVRQEYLSNISRTARALAVCSDKTAGHVRGDEEPSLDADPTLDTGHVRASDLGCRVEQDARKIAAWIREGDSKEGMLSIIFSTYQSAHEVAEALEKARKSVGVLICDEAHRTAQLRPAKGRRKQDRLRAFTLCHDQDAIPASYRLYQTATPRVYSADNEKVAKARSAQWEVSSMDDQSVFGPVAYRLPYAEAVEKGLLCDYRIIAIAVDKSAWDTADKIVQKLQEDPSTRGITTRDAVSWLVYGAVLGGGAVGSGASEPLVISRSLAFLDRVAKSKEMEKWLSGPDGRKAVSAYLGRGEQHVEMLGYAVEHLDADHTVAARKQALRDLGSADAVSPRGICNVAIFGEGTDCPTLDAVALLAPRRSPVEVIQIVGRCMRRAPGKTSGYVIVPLPLPRGIDAETSLSMGKLGDEWRALGDVLRALRAHDGRIEMAISSLLQIYVPPEAQEKVHHVIAVRDGGKARMGTWYGVPGYAEDAIAKAEVPAWSEGTTPITEILTEKLGFAWQNAAVPDEASGGFTGHGETADRAVLEAHQAVFVARRARDGLRCETLAPRFTTDGLVDSRATAETAITRVNEQRKPMQRRPRRRSRRGTPVDRRDRIGPLLEPLKDDGLGRDFRVEVMEKSGLRGNSIRDFNLLMEPVSRAADQLRAEGLESRLAEVLGMADLESHDQQADACTVAAVLLLNAAILHARLEGATAESAVLADNHSLGEVETATVPADTLETAWTAILGHDYKPIFEPSLHLLRSLVRTDARSGVSGALRTIAAWSRQNAENYASMGMEYAGELFSRVMGGQASDGAFFTRQMAARLLAELALDATGLDNWTDRRIWRQLSVTDLACGSGTLLNAWAEVVKDRIRQAGGQEDQVRAFHKYAVERLITGLDINPVSLQLAGARLTLGNLDANYRKMRLHSMQYGAVESGDVRVGSLELLTDEDLTGSTQGSARLFHESTVGPDLLQDVANSGAVLMNPPFSSNQQRAGKLGPEIKKQMGSRELALRNHLSSIDEEAGRVFDANSIRTMFTPLADKVLDRKKGVLAEIVPVTALTATSGVPERAFLAARFHIDLVLCCHDPKNPNLSEHTAIHEALFIASRRRAGSDDPTLFVSLRSFPRTAEAVRDVVTAIRERRFAGIGTICEWPRERMLAGDWTPVQWYDPSLAETARSVEASSQLERLGESHAVGPAGRRIQDAYTHHSEDRKHALGAMRGFHSVSADLRKTLQAAPEVWYVPKAGRQNLAKKYAQQRSRLLVPMRFDTISGRMTGVWASEPSFGWWMPVTIAGESEGQALAAWFNSTPARLMLLNRRARKLTYPVWQVAHWQEIRIPKPENPAWDELAAAYQEVCEMEMLPMQEPECPVRGRIDKAAAVAVGADPTELAEWRRKIAAEPTVSGSVAQ